MTALPILRDAFQGALRLLCADQSGGEGLCAGQQRPDFQRHGRSGIQRLYGSRRAGADRHQRQAESERDAGPQDHLQRTGVLADARRLDRRGLPVGVPSGIQREHLRCDGAQLVLRFARLSGQYGYYQKFGAGALYRASEGRLSGQEVAEGGRQHVVCALQQQQRQLERRIGFLDGQHLRVLCTDAPFRGRPSRRDSTATCATC